MDIHTKTIKHDPIFSDGSDSDIIGRLTVESGEMASMVVGFYEGDFPQPNFHIEVSPKSGAVSTTLVRTDDKGEYKLTYHFQNFQPEACRVIIRKCET